MKKKFLLITLLIMVFAVTGCGSKNNSNNNNNNSKNNDSVMTCTAKGELQEGITSDSTYKVTYNGENVKSVETLEKITVDDEEVLKYLEEKVRDTYSLFDDIKHYDYTVKVKDNTLVSTTSIDYEKIDIDKLFAIDSSIENLFEDGKLKIDDLKSYYKMMGISCK